MPRHLSTVVDGVAIAPSHVAIRSAFPCAGCGGPTVIRRDARHPDTAMNLWAPLYACEGPDLRFCLSCFQKPSRVAAVVNEARRAGKWKHVRH